MDSRETQGAEEQRDKGTKRLTSNIKCRMKHKWEKIVDRGQWTKDSGQKRMKPRNRGYFKNMIRMRYSVIPILITNRNRPFTFIIYQDIVTPNNVTDKEKKTCHK